MRKAGELFKLGKLGLTSVALKISCKTKITEQHYSLVPFHAMQWYRLVRYYQLTCDLGKNVVKGGNEDIYCNMVLIFVSIMVISIN